MSIDVSWTNTGSDSTSTAGKHALSSPVASHWVVTRRPSIRLAPASRKARCRSSTSAAPATAAGDPVDEPGLAGKPSPDRRRIGGAAPRRCATGHHQGVDLLPSSARNGCVASASPDEERILLRRSDTTYKR
jgi:hypothetical protein